MAKKVTEKQPRRKSTKKSITEPKKTAWYKMRQNIHNLSQQRQRFLARRPHRSFRLTQRRDYHHDLNISGYWSITSDVWRLIWRHKKTFLSLIAVLSMLTVVLSSIMSQDTYQQLKDTLHKAEEESGLSGVYTTLGLFSGVVASYFSGSGTAGGNAQQVATGAFLGLLAWLSTIWLVRAILLGKKPKMRDGLYNSGAPIVSLIVISGVLLLQLVPASIAVIVYSALDSSGVLSQTPILMAAGGAAILITTMSVYWATSTIFAMIIVTFPGMYPFHALRLAGDVVTGRRVRILLRFAWVAVLIALLWIVVLIPTILFDGAVKGWISGIDWLPIVPVAGLILVYLTIVVVSVYVYIFYRKVVESGNQKTKN